MNEQKKYDYGCVMAYVKVPMWNYILKQIETADIHNNGKSSSGLETNPHVTILYGLHEDVPDEDVRSVINDVDGRIDDIETDGITLFDSNEDFDVLKFDIKSPKLVQLNKQFSKLDHTTSFPNYHPHLTISYINKGVGDKYLYLADMFSDLSLESRVMVYSKTDGTEVYHFLD